MSCLKRWTTSGTPPPRTKSSSWPRAHSPNPVGELFVYALPLNYYEQLPASINAVSAPDVERVAKKYIHPESAVVIGAGDRAKIEEQLKKLSIGTVEVRDYEGVPVIGSASPGESH